METTRRPDSFALLKKPDWKKKKNQKLIVTLDNAKDMVLGRSRISASRG